MPKEISKHKQQFEEQQRNMEKKLEQAKDNEKKELDLKAVLRKLPRVPGNCPVGMCKEVVFPCNMMMHVIHKHMHVNSEIYEHKPHVMCFDPMCCAYGVNCCMASFMYGGVEGKPETQPGLRYLINPNSALYKKNQKYQDYLPIMMMVCRSTWYAQLKDKQLERQLVSINASKAGIYVFWLVAPKTTRKLYYSLTVYDRYYLNSRSVIRLVRDYTSFQNPSDFLPLEDNYLVLRDSEINNLMLNASSAGKQLRPGIPIELIIYENPIEKPLQHSTQRQLQEALEDF